MNYIIKLRQTSYASFCPKNILEEEFEETTLPTIPDEIPTTPKPHVFNAVEEGLPVEQNLAIWVSSIVKQ